MRTRSKSCQCRPPPARATGSLRGAGVKEDWPWCALVRVSESGTIRRVYLLWTGSMIAESTTVTPTCSRATCHCEVLKALTVAGCGQGHSHWPGTVSAQVLSGGGELPAGLQAPGPETRTRKGGRRNDSEGGSPTSEGTGRPAGSLSLRAAPHWHSGALVSIAAARVVNCGREGPGRVQCSPPGG